MRARWFWLFAIAGPIVGGLLFTLSPTDPMAAMLFFAGFPATVVAASLATWLTMPLRARVAKVIGAVLVGAGFFLLVVPVVFFTSYVLFVALIGDDETAYF